MKTANAAVIALLNSGADFQMADLWTLTLSGGAVVRWSAADVPLYVAGQNFLKGPVIERSAITEKIGLDVATLTASITADSLDLINGKPIIPFIRARGLDGALLRIDRVFMPDWATPPVGTILRFGGRVTSINSIAGSTANLTVSSWSILLNANMPANLYQTGCLHSVYDSGCSLLAASYAVSGSVTGTPTANSFSSTLSTAASDFAQGRIVFTSGANAGLSISIKDNDGAGGFTAVRPFPSAAAAGDTFTAYPGCSLTQARCGTRFNNLAHFKGTPYVPVPETAFV